MFARKLFKVKRVDYYALQMLQMQINQITYFSITTLQKKYAKCEMFFVYIFELNILYFCLFCLTYAKREMFLFIFQRKYAKHETFTFAYFAREEISLFITPFAHFVKCFSFAYIKDGMTKIRISIYIREHHVNPLSKPKMKLCSHVFSQSM